MDSKGRHGLSCKKSAGRHSRHGAINDIVQRALTTVGYQAIREPPGIDRGNGKRPDGMTRIPWREGKPLLWDATVVDTVCQSYIGSTSQEAGTAAEKAEGRKMEKYADFAANFKFVPLGFETCGSWGSEALALVKTIGKKLSDQTGENRSTSFLTQSISIELQRGNASSVLGTFPFTRDL